MQLNKPLRSLLSVGTLLSLLSPVHAATLDPLSPQELVEDAQLILQGVVTKIEYKNSEAAPGHVSLPHTFVTFAVERTFKGNAADKGQITLRFEGGPDGTGNAMMASGIPLFDLGDRDILFVGKNRDLPCPLVGWEQGRFRLLNGSVYNEQGQEVGVTADDQLAFGAYHALPEVTTHNMGGTILTFEETEPEAKPVLPPQARRLDAAGLANFIDGAVRKHHTPQQLATVPPVPSADIRRPLRVFASKAERPPSATAPSQGIGKGERNAAEEQLLQQSDGDPLFKGANRSNEKPR